MLNIIIRRLSFGLGNVLVNLNSRMIEHVCMLISFIIVAEGVPISCLLHEMYLLTSLVLLWHQIQQINRQYSRVNHLKQKHILSAQFWAHKSFSKRSTCLEVRIQILYINPSNVTLEIFEISLKQLNIKTDASNQALSILRLI